MYRGGGCIDRGRGRSSRGYNGGTIEWKLNWGPLMDSGFQAPWGAFNNQGRWMRASPLMRDGGPTPHPSQFSGGNRGFSSFNNPLWSDYFEGDMGNYYDTKPVPFQEGAGPEVEVKGIVEGLALAQ